MPAPGNRAAYLATGYILPLAAILAYPALLLSGGFFFTGAVGVASLIALVAFHWRELRERGLTGRLVTALSTYLLLALVVTCPASLHLRSRLIGDGEGDSWKHLWGFWWIQEAHQSGTSFPTWTDLLSYPHGGTLYFIDPLGASLSALIRQALSPFVTAGLLPLTYNVVVILNLVLAAFAAFLLAWYLTKSARGAVLAGAVFGFSPHLLTRVVSGITEGCHIAYIPLFILFLLRSVFEKSLLNPVLAGVFLALCFVGNPYFGLFALIMGPVMVGGALVRLRERLDVTSLVMRVLVFFFVFLIPFNLFLHLFFTTLSAKDGLAPVPAATKFFASLAHKGGRQVDLEAGKKKVCTVADYFLIGKGSVSVLNAWDRLTLTGYPGLLAMGLAGLAAIFVRRRFVKLLGALAIIFAVLSLGPEPYLSNTRSLGMRSLPYALAAQIIPCFRMILTPEGFSTMVSLCISALCAYAVPPLERALPKRRVFVAWGLLLLVTLEVLLVSPAPYPLPAASLPDSPVFAEWGRDRRAYGIINVPAMRGAHVRIPGEYFYHQTVHRKGMLTEINPQDRVFECEYPLISHLAIRQLNFVVPGSRFTVPPMGAQASADTLSRLKRDGFRYVVLHEDLVPPELLAEFRRSLQFLFGPPRHSPPDKSIFAIE